VRKEETKHGLRHGLLDGGLSGCHSLLRRSSSVGQGLAQVLASAQRAYDWPARLSEGVERPRERASTPLLEELDDAASSGAALRGEGLVAWEADCGIKAKDIHTAGCAFDFPCEPASVRGHDGGHSGCAELSAASPPASTLNVATSL
jgi:hypothetical protein